MKRPRLKDIAERAGCSIAVVSHVVNQASGNISCRSDLRDLILQTAAELNYSPHYGSRVLKNRRLRTIGLYIPPESTGVMSSFESALLAGIERVCRKKAYDLLIIPTHNAQHIDGLILLQVENDADWLFALAEKKRTVMAINYYGDAPIDTINFDDKAAAALAVIELHQAGHRRIAYIGPIHTNAGKNTPLRLEGFISTCVSLGITIDPSWIFDDTFPGTLPLERAVSSKIHAERRIAESIAALPSNQRPTAIIGYSDPCTVCVMRELQRLKLNIPDDISAIGIGNSTICPFVQPQLASIQQPLMTMGEEAAKHIIEQLEHPLDEQSPTPGIKSRWHKLSEPTFIQRESVRSI